MQPTLPGMSLPQQQQQQQQQTLQKKGLSLTVSYCYIPKVLTFNLLFAAKKDIL